MKFNINANVKVKLKPHAIAELKRQHNELLEVAPNIGEFNAPKVDEDGYSQFQMWSLMGQLGHLCQLGLEPPFDTEIIILT